MLFRRGTSWLTCTCWSPPSARSVSAKATPRPLPPTASTSAVTLDSPPLFQHLLPASVSLPLQPISPTSHKKSRRAVPKQLPPPTTTTSPTRKQQADPRRISPYLPLFTRERSYLLSEFRNELRRDPSDVDRLWEAFAALVQYPGVVPDLRPSFRPTSERAPDEPGSQGAELRRHPIHLSIADLRAVFNSFSRARPRTRNGLSRLLVVVELLATRALRHPLPAAPHRPPNPRDLNLEELRGGGIGLRERDWRQLILWAALSYRAPRPTHEVATATSLFTQWSRANTLDQVPPRPTPLMYNALLEIGMRAKAWDLVEAIEDRMARENVRGDSYTLGIRLRRDHLRGAHVQVLWAAFEGFLALQAHRASSHDDGTPVWNTMVWILAERGMLGDARRIYDAMRRGTRVSVPSLQPEYSTAGTTDLELWTDPPAPDEATYNSLAHAYAFRGDLRSSLHIIQDMVTPTALARLPTFSPRPGHFTALFRAFATFGLPPPGHDAFATDPFLLSGKRVPNNARAATGQVDVVGSLRFTRAAQDGEDSPWTFSALEALFRAFLALSPTSLSPVDPHGGKRTAPSPRVVYWVLLAFERLSGSDSELVLKVWKTLVDTFGMAAGGRDHEKVWRGWIVDGRIRGLVEKHRTAVSEEAV